MKLTVTYNDTGFRPVSTLTVQVPAGLINAAELREAMLIAALAALSPALIWNVVYTDPFFGGGATTVYNTTLSSVNSLGTGWMDVPAIPQIAQTFSAAYVQAELNGLKSELNAIMTTLESLRVKLNTIGNYNTNQQFP
jgi:hypothetical protein